MYKKTDEFLMVSELFAVHHTDVQFRTIFLSATISDLLGHARFLTLFLENQSRVICTLCLGSLS